MGEAREGRRDPDSEASSEQWDKDDDDDGYDDDDDDEGLKQ